MKQGNQFYLEFQIEDENGNKIEPYYASIIFLADNFDDSKLNELYVEEEIQEFDKEIKR